MSIETYSRYSDDGVRDLLAEIGLSGFLHLDQDHGRDLLGSENLLLTLASLHLDVRLAVPIDDLEGEVLNVLLDRVVTPVAANETLGIEHRVLRVRCELILSGVADQTLALCGECDIGWGDSVALVVGDNFNSAVFENSNTEKMLQHGKFIEPYNWFIYCSYFKASNSSNDEYCKFS